MPDAASENPARWPHRLAVLTVLAALPLVLLGAEVTSKKVGMADPVWPTAPWYLVGNPSLDRGIGFVIEHSHRLAGWTVGFSALALMLTLWLWEPRRWLCWLGTAAALGILVQGLLGGMRVVLHAWLGPDLALIHGCVGQIVFALLVSVAVCTSRRWAKNSKPILPSPLWGEGLGVRGETVQSITPHPNPSPQRGEGLSDAYPPSSMNGCVRRSSLLLIGLVVVQLLLGAFMRHKDAAAGKYGHLLVAFAVVATAVWLVKEISDHHADNYRLLAAARWLAVLLVAQLLLGVEAWMIRFAATPATGMEHWLFRRDLVRSIHVLVGAGVLATAVVLSLESWRRPAWALHCDPEPANRLEGAA